MYPDAVTTAIKALVPGIRIVENERRDAVFLVHSAGVELLGDEIDAERRAPITGSLFAGAVFADGHVIMPAIVEAAFGEMLESMECGSRCFGNEHRSHRGWYKDNAFRTRAVEVGCRGHREDGRQ